MNGEEESMNSIVFIDLETSGLNEKWDDIIELGATKTENGETLANFHTYVKPRKALRFEVEELTGVTNDHLVDVPCLSEALEKFFRFWQGSLVVFYNADFDEKFLQAKAKECGLAYPETETLDLRTVAKEKLPGLKNYNLSTVAEKCGIYDMRTDCLSCAIAEKKIYGRFLGFAY